MPTLISEKIVTLEFTDLERRTQLLGRPASPPSRTAGVHLSGVLSYIAHQIGILKPGEKDEEDISTYPLLWGRGCAWEEYIFSFFPNIDWQPGEVTVDGVSMNADGLSVDEETGKLVLEEAKFTFKSEVSGEDFLKSEKFWLWRKQVLGYCKGYGPRVTRHHVCHVRGAYKEFGPTYKQYVVGWEDKEVNQNWVMVLNNKDKAEPEG